VKPFSPIRLFLAALPAFLVILSFPAQPADARDDFPEAVKIVAPNGLPTNIYKKPRPGAEIVEMAIDGDVLEKIADSGNYVEVRLPGKEESGFVLRAHTDSWTAPIEKGLGSLVIVIVLVILAGAIALGVLYYLRSRKSAEAAEKLAASISEAIRSAENLYRAEEYEEAIREFKRYLNLHGGEVRNPDLYRRLAVCYQKINETQDAAVYWEKMRSLGGLKTIEDYTLGVELMMALGRTEQAAAVYEQLLEQETDEDKRYETHRKLFDTYRRLKRGDKVVKHAVELIASGIREPEIIPTTVRYLIEEGQTDLAIEELNKDLITAICSEFMEEKAMSPAAARIYEKCLEYDRTDPALHRALAQIYKTEGDVRKAVSELIMLHQLDKNSEIDYMEDAARLYVESSMVPDALAEGNPIIVKKIAQIFLAKSEVNPDAVAVYEKVLEFQPMAVGVNKILSTVYMTRGDLNKYLEKLRLLHQIDGPNHDYLGDLAQCVIDNDLIEETLKEGNRELNAKILTKLIKRGAYDDRAVALFERLIKYEPNNILIRRSLAHAYERRGEHEKCVESLIKISEQRPRDKDNLEKAAKSAVEWDLLEPILKRAGKELLALTANELITQQNKSDLGKQVLEKALKEMPKNGKIASYVKTLRSSAPPAPKPKPPAKAVETKSRPKPIPIPKAEKPKPPPTPAPKEEKPLPPPEPMPEAEEDAPEPPPPPSIPAILEVEVPELDPVSDEKPAVSKPIIDAPALEDYGSEVPPVTTFVSSHQKQLVDEREAEEQVERIRETQDASQEEHPVTTFVSSHAKRGSEGSTTDDELFVPAAGGLAYVRGRKLLEDGWGEWRVGTEVNTEKTVVLRILRQDLLEPPKMAEFVTAVTDLGFNMVHENVFELQEVAKNARGLHALVHPYYPNNLEQILNSGQAREQELMVKLIRGIVGALVYAHNHKGRDGKIRRTFHLHLQPSQIFLGKDPTKPKVAGFGYTQVFRNLTRAKNPRWEDPSMNPAYMPPEFFRTRSRGVLERAADIYSLGALAYHMVAGELPFEGPLFADFKYQHARSFPAPPRLVNQSVHDWMEPIILGCLEKDPEKRWNSVNEIQLALNREMTRGPK
jgi:tetratricopeptide (TPR) repeat protein